MKVDIPGFRFEWNDMTFHIPDIGETDDAELAVILVEKTVDPKTGAHTVQRRTIKVLDRKDMIATLRAEADRMEKGT